MNIEQMQQMLDILKGGTYICLVLALLSLAAAALMFWRFNMLEIIKERTGIAERQAARQFNEEYAKTTGTLTTNSGMLVSGGLPTGKSASLHNASGTLKTRSKTTDIAKRRLPNKRSGTTGVLEGNDNTTRLPSQKLKAENPQAFAGDHSDTFAIKQAVPDASTSFDQSTEVTPQIARDSQQQNERYSANVGEPAKAEIASGVAITSDNPEQLGAGIVLVKEVLIIHTNASLED